MVLLLLSVHLTIVLLWKKSFVSSSSVSASVVACSPFSLLSLCWSFSTSIVLRVFEWFNFFVSITRWELWCFSFSISNIFFDSLALNLSASIRLRVPWRFNFSNSLFAFSSWKIFFILYGKFSCFSLSILSITIGNGIMSIRAEQE